MAAKKDDRVYQSSLRLTLVEKDILQEAADGLGIPLSTYIRMVLYERVSELKQKT